MPSRRRWPPCGEISRPLTALPYFSFLCAPLVFARLPDVWPASRAFLRLPLAAAHDDHSLLHSLYGDTAKRRRAPGYERA